MGCQYPVEIKCQDRNPLLIQGFRHQIQHPAPRGGIPHKFTQRPAVMPPINYAQQDVVQDLLLAFLCLADEEVNHPQHQQVHRQKGLGLQIVMAQGRDQYLTHHGHNDHANKHQDIEAASL